MTSRFNKETHLTRVPMSYNIIMCIVISFEKPIIVYAMLKIKVSEVGTLLTNNLENTYEYIPPLNTRTKHNPGLICCITYWNRLVWYAGTHVPDFHLSKKKERKKECLFRLNPVVYRPDICRCQIMHACNWRKKKKQTLSPLLQGRKLEQVSIGCLPKISSPASGSVNPRLQHVLQQNESSDYNIHAQIITWLVRQTGRRTTVHRLSTKAC